MSNKVKKVIDYNINFEPIVIHKATIDKCLSVENSSDCIALYTYYYYTAKWQKQVNDKDKYNTAYATNNYVMNQFNWGKKRMSDARNNLEKLGLIKPIIERNTDGTIIGHYVRIIFMYENVEKQVDLSTGSVKRPVDDNTTNTEHTNNINTELTDKSEINPEKQVDLSTGSVKRPVDDNTTNTEHTNNINTEHTDKSEINPEMNGDIITSVGSCKVGASEFFDSFRKSSVINSIPASEVSDSVSDILYKWQKFAKDNNLTSVLGFNKNRINLIRKRLKEKLFDFDKILNMISKSDYLLGKRGNWKVDIDWIIRDDSNYVRILEGKYTNNLDTTSDSIEDKRDIAWNKAIFKSFIIESELNNTEKKLNIEKIAKNLSHKVKSLKGYEDTEFDCSDSALGNNKYFNIHFKNNINRFMDCEVSELKYREYFLKNLQYLSLLIPFADSNTELKESFKLKEIIERFIEENSIYMEEII